MKIGVVGLWHLGCVLSACWAGLGYQVTGFDADRSTIESLQAGKAPLYEPHLDNALTDPHLRFTSAMGDLSDCQVVFLAEDTEVDDQDNSLTASLEEHVRALSRILPDGAVLIVSSQSPVGFCRRLRALLQAGNPKLELAYSPENLRLGVALECYLRPGHIVLGTCSPLCLEVCQELFSHLDGEILAMDLESAELVKHGINSFLANSIVFTNQLANVCQLAGANIDQVVRGMKSDRRIGRLAYLEPGVGFSGGTLGRDLKVLSARHDQNGPDFFGDLWRLNAERYKQVAALIERSFGPLKGLCVTVLGLTYKPGTSTLRRSIPLQIVEHLQQSGAAVTAYDPQADLSELSAPATFGVAKSVEEAARDSDLIVLLTAWPEFRECDWDAIASLMRQPRFFDAKNLLSESALPRFTYQSLGRSSAC